MREPRPGTGTAELPAGGAAEGLPGGGGLGEIAAVEATSERTKKKLGFGAWVAMAWLALVILAALAAPILPLPGANETVSGGVIARQGPTLAHPLGGDNNGRDVLSRVVFGARNSLVVGFGAVAIGGFIGGFLGLMAGYYRGKLETILVGLLDVMLAFPALVLALSLTIFLGRTLFNVTLALGIIAIPTLARIARANTLNWAQREFVLAARAQGAKDGRIIFREVLPNVIPAVASIALLAVAVVIVAEAGLSLLGAGLQPPAPTWGNVINEGRNSLTNGDAPHIVFAGSGAIFLTVLALNYLGDAVRARFEVKESGL